MGISSTRWHVAEDEAVSEQKLTALDFVRLLPTPTIFFRRLTAESHWSAALFLQLLLLAGIGLGVAQLGVIDFEIESATNRTLGRAYQVYAGEENQEIVNQRLDGIEKQSQFSKLLSRLQLIVGAPIVQLLSIHAIAGLLFGLSALAGRKPDYQKLAAILVFAGFTEVLRRFLVAVLISQLHASRVETSAAAIINDPACPIGWYLLARRLDPFGWWGWWLVGTGVIRTGQLPTRKAWWIVLGLWIVGSVLTSLAALPSLVAVDDMVAIEGNG